MARLAAQGAGLVALASCAPTVIPPSRPPAPPPSPPVAPTALSVGVGAGPAVTSLGLTPASAAKALAAFQISCPSLMRRRDASGLTQPDDWDAACAAASRNGSVEGKWCQY